MVNVRDYNLVSDQIDYDELSVIIREAATILHAQRNGAFVELGCYTGTTALFITRLFKEMSAPNELHVYDSFDGLPEKVTADNSPAGEQFRAGELRATKQHLIRHFKHFKQAGLPLPFIHKGWFEELTQNDMPAEIAFAFLDGDFYTSIESSLTVITPQLQQGAVILIDDYANEALPGARKAADKWAKHHDKSIRTEKSLGIIHW
jgi:O-methyltransferase